MKPIQIVEQSAHLLWITPGPEQTIERAGRVCYKSECKIMPDSAPDFVRKMLRLGHLSTIEHAVACFHLVTDRGVSHELVRHRIASYSQESTRYCDYVKGVGGGIAFVKPPGLSPEATDAWMYACQHAEHTYTKLRSLGCAPQIARSVLPTCLKTEIVMTANMREWRHVISVRTASGAHPQIRSLMRMVSAILRDNTSSLFEDFEPGPKDFLLSLLENSLPPKENNNGQAD